MIKKEKLQPQEKWNYKDFIAYIKWKYDIVITTVKCRSECNIPDDYICLLIVVLLRLIFTEIMVPMTMFSARYAENLHKLFFPIPLLYFVLIAHRLLQPRRIASFSEYTNALILNVHTILTILKRLIKASR